ncbi:MAG: dihydropteroate synthase [Candidatus Omnitrophica bacterium]|nr:dihydropteroate synthase [Candidatus Omnitrophota bacterium]
MMHAISLRQPQDLRKLMQDIGVDKYGIDIMLPKATHQLIKFRKLSSIAANILKQEMLSFGGEVAITRGALTGQVKKTDGLIMGNLSQYKKLMDKLKQQPFGLNEFSRHLEKAIGNCQEKRLVLNLTKFKFDLSQRTLIMGIVNLTPDSFSGDGLYRLAPEQIFRIVEEKIKNGCDIIDLGAESSRPGARPISAKEELNRLLPILKILVKKTKIPISIDTYKLEVARQVLDNGAVLINDITGLRNKKLAKLIARYNAGVVIMHMKGNPQTMQKNPVYKSLIDEIIEYLERSVNIGLDAGIKKEKIIIDPGIGFGKTVEHNLEILARLSEFRSLGFPLLIGASRKSFIGKLTNKPVQERLFPSIACAVLAAINGANIVRVHDIKETREALKVLDAIIRR